MYYGSWRNVVESLELALYDEIRVTCVSGTSILVIETWYHDNKTSFASRNARFG